MLVAFNGYAHPIRPGITAPAPHRKPRPTRPVRQVASASSSAPATAATPGERQWIDIPQCRSRCHGPGHDPRAHTPRRGAPDVAGQACHASMIHFVARSRHRRHGRASRNRLGGVSTLWSSPILARHCATLQVRTDGDQISRPASCTKVSISGFRLHGTLGAHGPTAASASAPPRCAFFGHQRRKGC